MERALMARSLVNNAANGITGILHRENGIYHQWLEGPDDIVSQTFDRISRDERHRNVRLLSRRRISSRLFQSWPMVYAGASGNSLFDWAALKGVPLHPSQPDEVLNFLKDCARRSAATS